MVRVPTEVTAAERAGWLAELSDALDEAQLLIWRLTSDASDADVLDLSARLETARAQVRTLQLGRQHHPQWTSQSLWNSACEERRA